MPQKQTAAANADNVCTVAVRVKWCGKSAPAVSEDAGRANPTWSKTVEAAVQTAQAARLNSQQSHEAFGDGCPREMVVTAD